MFLKGQLKDGKGMKTDECLEHFVDSTTAAMLRREGIAVLKRTEKDPPFPREASTLPASYQTKREENTTNSSSTSDEKFDEAMKAKERAKASEELWDTFVPDRKIGFTSPVFWVLLAACACLHVYNEGRDKSVTDASVVADKEDNRFREEAQEKQRRRLVAAQQSEQNEQAFDDSL